MSDDRFKIFVEQLRDGRIKEVDESFPPDFLEVDEKELAFEQPVMVKGQVYLAEENLVLHFDFAATAKMLCAVCNGPVDVPLEVQGFYHAVPLSEIKGAIYDFSGLLREIVLLEVPLLAECRQGKCPQRKSMEKYLKSKNSSGTDESEGYRPFADFDFGSMDKKKKVK